MAATYLVPSASLGIHMPVGFLVLDSLCIFLLRVSLATFSVIQNPTGNRQRELVGILRKRKISKLQKIRQGWLPLWEGKADTYPHFFGLLRETSVMHF